MSIRKKLNTIKLTDEQAMVASKLTIQKYSDDFQKQAVDRVTHQALSQHELEQLDRKYMALIHKLTEPFKKESK